MSLVPEVGKCYMTRDMGPTGPIRLNQGFPDSSDYKFEGEVRGFTETWNGLGRFRNSGTSPCDLMWEHLPGRSDAPSADTEESLVLSKGRWYQERGGKVAGPVQDLGDGKYYRWAARIESGYRTWTSNGVWHGAGPSEHDLVREVRAPEAGLLAAPPKASTPTKLQLELGKYYEDKQGTVHGPMRANPSNSTYIFTVPGSSGWRADGQWGAQPSDQDLVREVPAPDAVPAGRVVLDAEPAAPEKPVIPIDQMRAADYQRGIDAIWGTFRLLP